MLKMQNSSPLTTFFFKGKKKWLTVIYKLEFRNLFFQIFSNFPIIGSLIYQIPSKFQKGYLDVIWKNVK